MKLKIPPDRRQNIFAFDFIKDRFKEKCKLLDVGASDCLLGPYLPENIKYYSLDVVNCPGIKHDFVVDLDKEKIPVKEGFFDIILCLDTIEHTSYPEQVIEELIRVSKPDATFVFSIPNEYNFLLRFYYLFAIKTKTELPWKVVPEHMHIQKPRIKDAFDLLSKYFDILDYEFHWESRVSGSSWLFISIDRFINLLSKVYPNMFARDGVFKCKLKKKKVEETKNGKK